MSAPGEMEGERVRRCLRGTRCIGVSIALLFDAATAVRQCYCSLALSLALSASPARYHAINDSEFVNFA